MSAVPDDGSEPNITLVHRDGGHAQDAAGGSFQVPDSDNDESLEELAALQEQEYWSMLGIEEQEQQQDHEDDEQTAVDAFSSSPRSIVSANSLSHPILHASRCFGKLIAHWYVDTVCHVETCILENSFIRTR